MNVQTDFLKPVANKAETKVVRIEFDGGTPCNIPRLGYGIGYGSFRINCEPVVRVDHKRPMSANAAEILTLVEAVKSLQSVPSEIKLLIVGDSQIALKWARAAINSRKSKISRNASPEFVSAIRLLSDTLAAFASVETLWQPREKSVAVFGH